MKSSTEVYVADEFVPVNLGVTIRLRRKHLKLTLNDVATASGLSVGFVSQVERGQTIPSLMSLYHIGEALRIEMSELLRVSNKQPLYRRASDPEYLSVPSQIAYVKLSNRFPNQKLDALSMEIPPKYESTAQQGDSMHYDLQKTLGVSSTTSSTTSSMARVV